MEFLLKNLPIPKLSSIWTSNAFTSEQEPGRKVGIFIFCEIKSEFLKTLSKDFDTLNL